MLADMLNFRADIYAGEREVLVRYYEADDIDAGLKIARQEVVSLGHDSADVWQGDDLNHAAYVDTVRAEQ